MKTNARSLTLIQFIHSLKKWKFCEELEFVGQICHCTTSTSADVSYPTNLWVNFPVKVELLNFLYDKVRQILSVTRVRVQVLNLLFSPPPHPQPTPTDARNNSFVLK